MLVWTFSEMASKGSLLKPDWDRAHDDWGTLTGLDRHSEFTLIELLMQLRSGVERAELGSSTCCWDLGTIMAGLGGTAGAPSLSDVMVTTTFGVMAGGDADTAPSGVVGEDEE